MSSLSQLKRQDASLALVLMIACAGVILASLDVFIVNVALPTIARDLHERSLASLSWVDPAADRCGQPRAWVPSVGASY